VINMPQQPHQVVQVLAAKEAVRVNRPDLALALIQNTAVRPYTDAGTPGGFPVKDNRHPVPDGTVTAVFVASRRRREPVFYVVPAAKLRKLAAKMRRGDGRDHNCQCTKPPGHIHGILTPEDLKPYLGRWDLA
jgi:hypothetical protein